MSPLRAAMALCAVLAVPVTGFTQAAPAGAPAAADPPGKAIYERTCAACHEKPAETRSPPRTTLQAMRYQQIYFALTEGKMKPQAAMLSEGERVAVTDFLAGRAPVDDSWIAGMMCARDRGRMNLGAAATVAGFGFDARSTRRLTARQAGLTTADMPKLELAWALAFPKVATLRAQAAVVGNTLFLPVADASRLFAVDIGGARPCFWWVYENLPPLRSSAAYGELPGGRKVLAFTDGAGYVHLVDALTGRRVWRRHVAIHELSNMTAAPVFHGARLYVSLSASEITVGADEHHVCCTSHGAVTALDARTGATLWTAHTMENARPQRDRGDGQMMWGPSGAPVWNTPVVDERRGVLYVGTGEATSAPAAPTTDAILAIDLQDGRIRWHFQATPNDIFLSGCMAKRDGLNCPREGQFLDVDFGAGVLLARRTDGKDVLLAGQKSGTVWALDPDAQGKVLWRRDFGKGSAIGGVHWGIAFDGERVFAPINLSPGPDGKDPNQTPGLNAVDVTTGEVAWQYENKADCSGARQTEVRNCASWIGMSGAPTVIDGAVLQGSSDGFLRAFDGRTGALLFQYDTAKPVQGVNGVAGHGGAIDNVSIVAANGYVFVNSGYGLFAGQTPGNLFMAFKVRKP